MNEIGTIILAAGSSSRMSGSKQMLHVNGESLLRKCTRVVKNLEKPALVVLGHDFETHKAEISDMDMDITFNLDWQKGMGSSLKFGLNQLHHNYPTLNGVLITVCDQPHLSTHTLINLIKVFDDEDSIVASYYNQTVGPPVIFGRNYFKELLKIEDHQGAKYLLNKYETKKVSFPEGAIDIDTDREWENFKSEF